MSKLNKYYLQFKNPAFNTPKFKSLLILGAAVAVIGCFLVFSFYDEYFRDNVVLRDGTEARVYIRTEYNTQQAYEALVQSGYIRSPKALKRAMETMDFKKVHPGSYVLKEGMNNKQIVRMLAAGLQTPVTLRFESMRTKEALAAKLATQVEPDSFRIISFLNNAEALKPFGLNPDNVMTVFIPNSYSVYWATSPEKLIERMVKENERFWNEERRNAAKALNMNPQQVYILASIITEESYQVKELPRIAGVYVNRLKKGIQLQADPTVKFATGDFSLRRILFSHTRINHPYNTYIHKGLPPGPICIPTMAALQAALHPEQHKYMYFCAKPELDGYHNFSVTHAQHERFAAAYRAMMDRMKTKSDSTSKSVKLAGISTLAKE